MIRAVVLATTVLALAGCGDDDAGDDPIRIENPVVGETPQGADAAVYFDVVGGSGDALVGATSPVAAATSLHTMEPVEGGGIMYPTDRIPLEGDVTTLAPLGTHVMLEELSVALVDGDTVAVTLLFEEHGGTEVVVDVVPLADLADLLPEQQ